MQGYEQAVFISYAWGGEREEIVNHIDEALLKRGIQIVRDKRALGYKGSISGFMERLGRGSCVIVIISDKYLRSPNCMFELVKIADNQQFYDRIFPIVLADADIYDPVKRIEYVKYWEAKRAELAEAIKSVDPANLQGIREDMDLYDRIRDKISGLTSILKDMNTLTPDMHQDSDFTDLYDNVTKRIREGPAAPSAESDKGKETAQSAADPGQNVRAANGSIGIGSLNIGGNASGNIVIGNNNLINNNDKD
jgi:internalin A